MDIKSLAAKLRKATARKSHDLRVKRARPKKTGGFSAFIGRLELSAARKHGSRRKARATRPLNAGTAAAGTPNAVTTAAKTSGINAAGIKPAAPIAPNTNTKKPASAGSRNSVLRAAGAGAGAFWSRMKADAVHLSRELKVSRLKFKRAGGFGTLFKRIRKGILNREPATIGVCAGILLVIIAIPVIIIAAGNRHSAAAKAAAPEATPAGYVDIAGELAAQPQTPEPTRTPVPTPTPVSLSSGATDDKVIDIQQRLMELGYMDVDEPTSYYGPITKKAVETFQRRSGLTVDGMIGDETYDALMRADAKTYMVSVGDEGTDVQELQKRLVELDYMTSATGYFGTDTEDAVKDFQTRNHLDVDGMIGIATREMIYSEDAVAKSLYLGEQSDEVLRYQKRLYSLGYLTTQPDGTFGRDTVAAVRVFQELNGLIADGHIGPETRRILNSSSAQANALTIGMSGDTVKSVQMKLKSLKYLSSADGYYGSATESAVKAFQKRNGLSADGKVGRVTMSVLLSSKAKAAASSSKPSSSSGSSSGSSGSSSYKKVTGSATADGLISLALTRLGCSYVTGAKGPNSFDCSGFVYWCLNKCGVSQGYMTSKTWRTVGRYQRLTSISEVRKGDILVFKMSSTKGHVGIAMSSSEMVDASSSEGKVVRRSFQTAYWKNCFYCAYRIF